jgi:hypothetical protein
LLLLERLRSLVFALIDDFLDVLQLQINLIPDRLLFLIVDIVLEKVPKFEDGSPFDELHLVTQFLNSLFQLLRVEQLIVDTPYLVLLFLRIRLVHLLVLLLLKLLFYLHYNQSDCLPEEL